MFIELMFWFRLEILNSMTHSADYIPYDFRVPRISIYGVLTDQNRFGKKRHVFEMGFFEGSGGVENCDPTFSGGGSKPSTAKHDV